MSAEILKFDPARQKRKASPKPARQELPEVPRYFCLLCDSDTFKAYAGGRLHCAGCGALITNVLVNGDGREAEDCQ